MRKIISRLAVVAGFLLAFSGCHLIHKSQAASEASPKPEKRTVASLSLSEGIPCNKGNFRDFIYTPGTHNCDLREVDFSGKDVSGGNFAGANLEGAVFVNSDCRNAVFTGAILTGADFSGADCAYANFEKVEDFKNTKWSYTIMIRAKFPFKLLGHLWRDPPHGAIFNSRNLQKRRDELRRERLEEEEGEEGEEGINI